MNNSSRGQEALVRSYDHRSTQGRKWKTIHEPMIRAMLQTRFRNVMLKGGTETDGRPGRVGAHISQYILNSWHLQGSWRHCLNHAKENRDQFDNMLPWQYNQIMSTITMLKVQAYIQYWTCSADWEGLNELSNAVNERPTSEIIIPVHDQLLHSHDQMQNLLKSDDIPHWYSLHASMQPSFDLYCAVFTTRDFVIFING